MSNLIEKWTAFETRDELMKEGLQEKKIEISHLSTKMSFGTAGIRGTFGPGFSHMNEVTISLAAYAYGKYLLANEKKAKAAGVVLANDNRHNGALYREVTSRVLNKLGIKTYELPENQLMATPLLSFLIRNLKAIGGVNITASHNPKNYNGFKVYNSFGGQLMPSETKKISEIMDKTDAFSIKQGEYNPTYIKESSLNKYRKEVLKLRMNDLTDLSVVYSPMHGTGHKLGKEIIEMTGVKLTMVEKQSTTNPDFSGTKSANPEDPKAYDDGIKIARKTKSDIIFVTDPDADRVGAVVKYKKRFKYITGNEMGALYLDFYLDQLKKNGGIPKDGYIVKSMVSTDMATKIATKYGVETREVHVGFRNIADMIENQKGTFLFGFEESYGFLINPDIARDKDAFQGLVGIIDMAAHYKNEGLSLFDKLKLLNKEFRIHRNIQKTAPVDPNSLKRLMNGLAKSKEIHGNKVKEVIDFRKDKKEPQKMIKVILRDGSWIVARPSGTEPKVKYYVQSIGMKDDSNLIHNVVYEKKMFDYIDEQAEYFPPKKFSWKTVIKYTIFVGIMVGLLYLVFKGVYGEYSTAGSSATSHAIDFLHSKVAWFFIGIVASTFFSIAVDSWMKYRLLRFHEQRVKFRHIFISSIMGSIVSYLTPLAIGGDGIGYWYLRRKGFKRAPLAATFLSSTILWQMKNLVLTTILLPMGLHMYKDLLFHGTVETRTVLGIFIAGLVWDLFSILMLWAILLSRRFQEWSITTSIRLLEWFPWTRLADPGQKAASFMAEFSDLRWGMKKMWKSPKVMLEALFYETLPKLFSIGALIYIGMGVVRTDLEYGQYWSQIVATDVVNTANSFSLTPGSTGFIEFISLHIRESIYVPTGGGDSTDTVINLDIIGKFLVQWPFLGLSALTAIIVVVGESRRKLYSTSKKGKKEDTTFYKKTGWIFPTYIVGWIALIFML